jgi:hypothetical protein
MTNSGVRRNVGSPLQNLNIKTVFSDKSNTNTNTYKNANTPNSNFNSQGEKTPNMTNFANISNSKTINIGLKALKTNEEL